MHNSHRWGIVYSMLSFADIMLDLKQYVMHFLLALTKPAGIQSIYSIAKS